MKHPVRLLAEPSCEQTPRIESCKKRLVVGPNCECFCHQHVASMLAQLASYKKANYDFRISKLETERQMAKEQELQRMPGSFELDLETERLFARYEKGYPIDLEKARNPILLIRLNMRILEEIDRSNDAAQQQMNEVLWASSVPDKIHKTNGDISEQLRDLVRRNCDMSRNNAFVTHPGKNALVNFKQVDPEAFESRLKVGLEEGLTSLFHAFVGLWHQQRRKNHVETGTFPEGDLEQLEDEVRSLRKRLEDWELKAFQDSDDIIKKENVLQVEINRLRITEKRLEDEKKGLERTLQKLTGTRAVRKAKRGNAEGSKDQPVEACLSDLAFDTELSEEVDKLRNEIRSNLRDFRRASGTLNPKILIEFSRKCSCFVLLLSKCVQKMNVATNVLDDRMAESLAPESLDWLKTAFQDVPVTENQADALPPPSVPDQVGSRHKIDIFIGFSNGQIGEAIEKLASNEGEELQANLSSFNNLASKKEKLQNGGLEKTNSFGPAISEAESDNPDLESANKLHLGRTMRMENSKNTLNVPKQLKKASILSNFSGRKDLEQQGRQRTKRLSQAPQKVHFKDASERQSEAKDGRGTRGTVRNASVFKGAGKDGSEGKVRAEKRRASIARKRESNMPLDGRTIDELADETLHPDSKEKFSETSSVVDNKTKKRKSSGSIAKN